MRTLVVGTNNSGKFEDFLNVLDQNIFELRFASDYGHFDPEETGKTLIDNAIIKARAAMELSKEWTIADDTGVFVDALNGLPGVDTAYYGGTDKSIEKAVARIQAELKGLPLEKRGATFSTAIAFCRPGKEDVCFEVSSRGVIVDVPTNSIGKNGFRFDKAFQYDIVNKVSADMTIDERKQSISRYVALIEFCKFVKIEEI